MNESIDFGHCGMVAIVGRPNVGKSTLLNHLIRQKISITTRKPQTTRHQVLGISTQGLNQIIYVDTPGLQVKPKQGLNRHMNKAVTTAVSGVELILFVVEALQWRDTDAHVLQLLRDSGVPVILIVNKIDRVTDKSRLLPYISERSQEMAFQAIIPLCAMNNEDTDRLEAELIPLLPVGPLYFPEDQVTDRSSRFMAAELIREKLMRTLGDELPYSLGVSIEDFKEDGDMMAINAIIWVERVGQKNIVIGKKGANLKKIGEQARADMEDLFGQKVFLQTWVKVRDKWTENERALHQMGYDT